MFVETNKLLKNCFYFRKVILISFLSSVVELNLHTKLQRYIRYKTFKKSSTLNDFKINSFH